MRKWRAISPGREVATAFAVFAMVLQVMLAPAVLERHTLSVETDYGLTLLCGPAIDHVTDYSAAPLPDHPVPDHHVHDCPCCFTAAGAAVLPQSAAVPVPEPRLAVSGLVGWARAQVYGTINLEGRQQPRAPPSLV